LWSRSGGEHSDPELALKMSGEARRKKEGGRKEEAGRLT